jgi:hypothetical protein
MYKYLEIILNCYFLTNSAKLSVTNDNIIIFSTTVKKYIILFDNKLECLHLESIF